jgi:hypothetical protein
VNAVLARAVATGTITDSFVPTPTPTPTPPVAPVLTQLAQTHAKWRKGPGLAVSARASRSRSPIGTSFSFTLNEPAGITLAFGQSVRGRLTHGRCVAQTRANRSSHGCSLMLTRGTLQIAGHAGLNRITFQGRLSRTQTLKLGSYTLAVTAINAGGQRSGSSPLKFTIVK